MRLQSDCGARASKVDKYMTAKETVKMSKFLSLILRHEPERVGLKLDASGWVNVAELLRALNEQGFTVTWEDLTHFDKFQEALCVQRRWIADSSQPGTFG